MASGVVPHNKERQAKAGRSSGSLAQRFFYATQDEALREAEKRAAEARTRQRQERRHRGSNSRTDQRPSAEMKDQGRAQEALEDPVGYTPIRGRTPLHHQMRRLISGKIKPSCRRPHRSQRLSTNRCLL